MNNLCVRGDLNLSYTELSELPELPENLTIGGSLYLHASKIERLPKGLVVECSLDLEGSNIAELPEDLVVGGYLDLSCTNIPILPEGLTVGNSLDLECSNIPELPENLTIGGSLNLSRNNISRLPKSLRVRGDIITGGRRIPGIRRVNHNVPSLLQWGDGKYIKVDGIFSEVVSHRGNVYIVKQIGSAKVRYLVTDGAGKWAHGDTLQDAKADLMYKIANRDTSAYAGLSLDSELSLEEAIEAYRVITGACSAGTKMFVTNSLPERMDRYTISDIIRLTEGQFGNEEFANFFNKK